MPSYFSVIVFIHVLSAVIWIGGMIAIRFAVHYSIQTIENPKIKLEKTLENLKRFFYLVIPSILSLLITAIIMIISFELNEIPNHYIVILKELIWTIMSVIFIIIYMKRNFAQKAFEKNDFLIAKKHLLPVANYFIPINIILGLFAIFFGIILRGF